MSDAPLCYGDVGLRDVLNKDLDPVEDETPEFCGFFLQPVGGGEYQVQYDGHAGRVMTFDRRNYDDVLMLIDDLLDCVFRAQEYDYQDNKEELVEWAGQIVTSDKERAEERPDLYVYIPEDYEPPEL